MAMNERPIPEAALRDENSVEMLRVWIAEQKIHCSIKIGMYRESMDIDEAIAWGTILADATRHIAKALQAGYGEAEEISVAKIRAKFNEELDEPTSDAQGEFVTSQPD